MHGIRLVVVCVCLSATIAAAGEPASPIPYGPMPEAVYKIFREAIESSPYKGDKAEQTRKNLAELERLRALPWPDLRKADFARLTIPAHKLRPDPADQVCGRQGQDDAALERKEQSFLAWIVRGPGDELAVLPPDFQLRRRFAKVFSKIEPQRPEERLAVLAKVRKAGKGDYLDWKESGFDSWELGNGSWRGGPPSDCFFNLAYAAALYGKRDEARAILHCYLSSQSFTEQTLMGIPGGIFYRGFTLLGEGASRAEVVNQWEATLKAYPNTRFPKRLPDLIAALRKQDAEAAALAASEAPDPEKLPLDQRIAYYVARLPEVGNPRAPAADAYDSPAAARGRQTLDAIERIGRPAVPALLDRLTDRRPTRRILNPTYGGERDGWKPIAQVRDLAAYCLGRTLKGAREQDPFLRIMTGAWGQDRKSYFRDDPKHDMETKDGFRKAWEETGGSDPRGYFLPKIEQGSFKDRLGAFRKLRAIAPDAIDVVATLRRLALDAPNDKYPGIIISLLEAGDKRLLPTLREMPGTDETLAALLKHGTPADARFLLDRARREDGRDADRAAKANSYALFCAASETDSPLSVLVLVALLKENGPLWRRADEGDECGILCSRRLIKITKHNEGYNDEDPPAKRVAAIERWLAWWDREGKAAYAKAHPGFQDLPPSPPEPKEDPAPEGGEPLPAEVEVHDAEKDAPIRYGVPKGDFEALVKAGQIVVGRDAVDSSGRFVSRQAAMQWFDRAQPVRGGVPWCDLIGGESALGMVVGPDGRAWFGAPYWQDGRGFLVPVGSLPDVVRQHWQDETPIIPGADLLGFDGNGRLWATPYDGRPAHACSPTGWDTLPAKLRSQAGLPPEVGSGEDAMALFGGGFHLDRKGRFFLADSYGVHVLDGDRWSYQPLVTKNYRRREDRIGSFCFAEGPDATVCVWATWDRTGYGNCYSGTVGCWAFEGGRWRHIDAVEKVRQVIPRGPEGLWIIGDRPLKKGERPAVRNLRVRSHWNPEFELVPFDCPDTELVILRDGKRIAGDEAHLALYPDLAFRNVRFVAQAPDGTAYLLIEDTTERDTLRRGGFRGLALPPTGPVRDLGEPAAEFFSHGLLDGRQVLIGPRGWLWASNRAELRAMSPDGKEFRTFAPAHRFAEWTRGAFDGKGRLFLRLWKTWVRIYTNVLQEPGAVADPLLPAMRVHTTGVAARDSLGRLWCTLRGNPPICARFDGKAWTQLPIKLKDTARLGLSAGFNALFPGSGGAMIAVDSSERFHLFDAEGHVESESAVDLLTRFFDRVSKALPYPPVGSEGGDSGHLLAKDARGRVWWAAPGGKWGVVDGGKAISGKPLPRRVDARQDNERYVFIALAPFGDGERLLVEEQGHIGVTARLDKGEILLGASPIPRDTLDYVVDTSYDRAGRLWVAGWGTCLCFPREDGPPTSHAGRMVLEDKADGLWSFVAGRDGASLIRADRAGRKLQLDIPCLKPYAGAAEAPDGTVWVASYYGLHRVRAEADKLSVIESFPARMDPHDEIGCDAQGRLWLLREWELIRYATTPRAPER